MVKIHALTVVTLKKSSARRKKTPFDSSHGFLFFNYRKGNGEGGVGRRLASGDGSSKREKRGMGVGDRDREDERRAGLFKREHSKCAH